MHPESSAAVAKVAKTTIIFLIWPPCLNVAGRGFRACVLLLGCHDGLLTSYRTSQVGDEGIDLLGLVEDEAPIQAFILALDRTLAQKSLEVPSLPNEGLPEHGDLVLIGLGDLGQAHHDYLSPHQHHASDAATMASAAQAT